MSSLSQFQMGGGGGGKLRFAEFLANGTFTPSAALIANGGQVFYEGAGGGGGGGAFYTNGTNSWHGGGGGSSYKRGLLIVTTPQAVTIGTGGAGKNYPGPNIQANGNNGTATTLGSLLTIYGGGGGGTAFNTRYLGKAADYGLPGSQATSDTMLDSKAGQGAGEGGGSPTTSGVPNSGGGGGGGTNTTDSGGNGGSGYLRLWWYE